MRQWLVAMTMLLTCSGVLDGQDHPCPKLETNVADRKFAPGQVWSYTTRPGEEGSTLTVLEVDQSEKLGRIIHVRVDGLKVHNPRGELVPSVEHMPFSRDTMLLSVTTLLRTEKKLPTFEGYDEWRRRCGGVYTISVSDAVKVMERTLNAS